MLSLEPLSFEEVNSVTSPVIDLSTITCSTSDAVKIKQQSDLDCFENIEFIDESLLVVSPNDHTIKTSASIPHTLVFSENSNFSRQGKSSHVSSPGSLSHFEHDANNCVVHRDVDELSSFFQEAALDTDVEEEDRSIHLLMRDSVASSRKSLIDCLSSYTKDSIDFQRKPAGVKADDDSIIYRRSLTRLSNTDVNSKNGSVLIAPFSSAPCFSTRNISAGTSDSAKDVYQSPTRKRIFSQTNTQASENVTAVDCVQNSLDLLSPFSRYIEIPPLQLLPPQEFRFHGRHTLVLDLDETLVHSSNIECDGFRPDQGDFKTDVILEDKIVTIYVHIRPGLINFLKEVARLFEVVVFTAGVEVYASAVIGALDPKKRYIHHLLHRAHCTRVGSSFAKDLSLLQRPLTSVIIIDNSPAAYIFQPRNAIPCTSWFDDRNDNELLGLLPLLRHVANEPGVYSTLDQFHEILARLSEGKLQLTGT